MYPCKQQNSRVRPSYFVKSIIIMQQCPSIQMWISGHEKD